MTRLIVSALALSAALASAAPAFAQETMSVKVSYADLNLGSAAGAKIFHQRLQNAVEEICGSPGLEPLAMVAIVRKCQRETWVGAAQAERQALAGASRTTQLAVAGEPPVR